MDPLPIHRRAIQPHLLPDSERLLRRHGAWVASWDASDQESDVAFDVIIKAAFNAYSRGLLPIQVGWDLAEKFPQLPARELRRAQRAAEKALAAAETAPPELRRAMVAATRAQAIQGALAAGEWSAALRGLDRAGEIAGELRESAGLGEEDLCLTVMIEAPPAPLPHSTETSETAGEITGETGGESQ